MTRKRKRRGTAPALVKGRSTSRTSRTRTARALPRGLAPGRARAGARAGGGRSANVKRSNAANRLATPKPRVEKLRNGARTSQPSVELTPLPAERQPYDGDTAYRLYLREIGQTPLLTIQEENKLAARIKRGDKAAREHMIKANLRLVVKIARDFEGYGLPLLDLINEGNMGLMKAVGKFDPAKGAKLSTYAAWWIKQSIKRALADQSKTIRLPVHVVDKLFNIRKAAIRLHDVLGREPTDEELSDEVGLPAAKIAHMRRAAIRPASLEAPLGDDEDSNRVGDVIADEKADSPYERLEEKTSTAMLRELLETLDSREATILRYRFGLDNEDEQTLEEIGEKFGVTRERIRQIQEMALIKLRKKIEEREAVQVAA